MKHFTTYTASQFLGCSVTHIYNIFDQGLVEGRWEIIGKKGRKVLRLSPKSVAAYASQNRDNPRIGRGMGKRIRPKKPMIKRGYRYVPHPNHPRADRQGYVAEHHLVMEEKIGRPLTKKECVHHIDRDRLNNHPDNLVLYASQADHMGKEHSEFLGLIFKVRSRPDLEAKVCDFIKTLLPT